MDLYATAKKIKQVLTFFCRQYLGYVGDFSPVADAIKKSLEDVQKIRSFP